VAIKPVRVGIKKNLEKQATAFKKSNFVTEKKAN
jgi:hypothetical protein